MQGCVQPDVHARRVARNINKMSAVFDKKSLIALVKAHRALYDKGLPEYYDRQVKINCWKAVAASLNEDVTGTFLLQFAYLANVLIFVIIFKFSRSKKSGEG